MNCRGQAKISLTLSIFLVSAACDKGSVSTSIRTSSQVVLSEPPSLYMVGDLNEDWRWRVESTDPAVELQQKLTTNETSLTVPGTEVLFTAIREHGDADYFLAGSIDAGEVFSLYRYHDVTADGAPDGSTETLLFSTGTRKAYVTDVRWAADGTAYMLDRRCQDILAADDTDADGWADSYRTTPFAMSDDFPELLDVVDLEIEDVGVVHGWTMSRDFAGRNRITSRPRFADSDKRPLEIRGTPYDGQTKLSVRGEPGEEVKVWELDGDLTPVTLLTTATLGSEWEEWTTISLGSALVAGAVIGVRYTGDGASQVADTVWDAWPQVVTFDRMIATYGPNGGELGLVGYNFTNDMTVKMTTPAGTTYSLTYIFVDSQNVTVDIPVLADNEMGNCMILVLDPQQPAGDGGSVVGIQVCPEEDVGSSG